jgi:hypothetical protein
VFTTAELAPYVFVAVERVLRTEFGIRSPRSMYSYAKQRSESVDAIKRELVERDYYGSLPYDLRPLPQALLRGDVRGTLDRVAARFHAYEGPVETPGEERTAPLVNSERMIDWLRQFDSDLLIEAGLRALQQIQFFGRQELIDALDVFLSTEERFRRGSIATLGKPKGSSGGRREAR